jgi:peptidoglycan/LPS O-acetylase OafA/YrhL
MEQDSRYVQLDALRGLAATTVVLSHFTMFTPLVALRHTPLRLLCGGHEAVILFFALSGFVLTLQIDRARNVSYGEYALRRVCRIYLPYLGAVSVAYIAWLLSYDGWVDWAGNWFNGTWAPVISNADLLRHVLFVLPFQSDRLDSVAWSLVYEMRISLIFMPIVLAVHQFRTCWSVMAAAALSVAVCVYSAMTRHFVLPASIATEWLPTAHYLLMFVVGSVLAKHRGTLCAVLARGSSATWGGVVVLSAGLVLYASARPISLMVPGVPSDFVWDWLVLIAVTGIIACAVAMLPFARVLLWPPLPFLGKISYSLYLFHAIVLAAVVHATGRLGPLVSLSLAAVLIVPVSYLGYVCLERPAMRLGSRLGRRLRSRHIVAKTAAGMDGVQDA